MYTDIIRDAFIFEGRKIEAEWHDALRLTDLPEVRWSQVYAIGQLDGQVPLVEYPNGHVNLPGGTTESGESLDDTIRRELIEEINCRIVSWSPLGYQILLDPMIESPIYQMRVFAQLEKIGDFVNDPGGSVTGYKLVPIESVNEMIGYGAIGSRIISLARTAINA